MRRLPVLLTAAAALAAPATAAAATGTVLSVDRHAQTIEVVDGRHVVHLLRYRGAAPTVRAGSQVSYDASGGHLARIRAVRNAGRSVTFLGRVLRCSQSGLVLRLADGRRVTLSGSAINTRPSPTSHRAHDPLAQAAAGGTLATPRPGTNVLVTESFSSAGEVTFSIVPANGPGQTRAAL